MHKFGGGRKARNSVAGLCFAPGWLNSADYFFLSEQFTKWSAMK